MLAASVDAAAGFRSSPICHVSSPLLDTNIHHAPVPAVKHEFQNELHGVPEILASVADMPFLRSRRAMKGVNAVATKAGNLEPDEKSVSELVAEKNADVVTQTAAPVESRKPSWLQWYDSLISPENGWLVPLLVKSITGGIVIGLGEVLQCILSGNGFRNNRILRWVLMGGLLVAPMQHFWFGWVFGFVGAHVEPVVRQYVGGMTATAAIVLICAIMDQILFGPIINTTILIANAICDRAEGSVFSRVKPLIIPAMKGNFILFFPAALVNFAIVPQQFRVLFINCVCVFWGCYMAYIARPKANSKSPKRQTQTAGDN